MKNKQFGFHEGSYMISSYFQQLSVTTTTTDAFGSKSPVNTVASSTVTPVCCRHGTRWIDSSLIPPYLDFTSVCVCVLRHIVVLWNN